MTIKAKRYDADSYQLFAGDALVAVAVRYSNDTWMAHDGAGRPLPEFGKHASARALAKAMSPKPTAKTVTASMDEARLIEAIRSVRGRKFDNGVLTEQPGSSLVLEHDKACMDAFLNQMSGPDVEVVRTHAKTLRDTGKYPWH